MGVFLPGSYTVAKLREGDDGERFTILFVTVNRETPGYVRGKLEEMSQADLCQRLRNAGVREIEIAQKNEQARQMFNDLWSVEGSDNCDGCTA
jgi:hypothetical protein